MPNSNNISRPISLVGLGRSGTSLIQMLFESHPEIDSVGETGSLIFDSWYSVASATSGIRPSEDGRTAEVRTRDAVLAGILTALPSEKLHWMQKPIGVPSAYNFWVTSFRSNEDYANWYWRVFTNCFPSSYTFTILRHPFDYVLSAQRYWGTTEVAAWEQLSLYAKILTSPAAKLNRTLLFDELASDPIATLDPVFDDLGISLPKGARDAAKKRYAERQGVVVGTLSEKPTFSYPHLWKSLHQRDALQAWGTVCAAWNTLGYPLDPNQVAGLSPTEQETATDVPIDAASVTGLLAELAALRKRTDGLENLLDVREATIEDLKGWILNREAVIEELLEQRGTTMVAATETVEPKQDDAYTKWLAALPSESGFWQQIIDGTLPNEEWIKQFKVRLTGEGGFPLYLLGYLGRDPSKARVLDVGSGPHTTLGPNLNGIHIDITAIDPLAEVYNAQLEKAGLLAGVAVKTELGFGERLVEKFSENSFDLVFSQNALDHSYNPLLAFEQMLAVCRPGGVVYVCGSVNEAVERGFGGLHQWNFMPIDGDLVVWSRAMQVSLRRHLASQAYVSAWRKPIPNKNFWYDCEIIKRYPPPPRA